MDAASFAATTLPPLPPASEIPNAFLDSVKQWWASGEKQMAISEERLLRRLPYFQSYKPDPGTPSPHSVVAYNSRVELSSPKKYLNTVFFTSTSPQPNAPPPAVLLHGYGAGLGFFFKNFHALADWAGRRGTNVYAVDWLGMGRSARVSFTVNASRKDVKARVGEAEAFFVDSLEEWRQKMGLDKMTLIGHSLGAYLSAAYALKYPGRVDKLILLSPAGVPRGPDYTVPSQELEPTESQGGGSAEPATNRKVEEIEAQQKQAKAKESRSRRLLTYLWEEGWSPFQVVRSSVFWGPMLVGKVC
uniref:AB hydrolase-1 domain-containing protein n=1 Tax=Moniliophthora roreri TaxID=221103 RepID=A0A0W0FCF9_MONRR